MENIEPSYELKELCQRDRDRDRNRESVKYQIISNKKDRNKTVNIKQKKTLFSSIANGNFYEKNKAKIVPEQHFQNLH